MEKLSRNLAWMAASNLASTLFGIILLIYLARTLMPEGFGYLSYTFTIIFFLANFVDLGLSTYGIRELAKDRDRSSSYVSEIASFRLLIAFVLMLLLLISSAALTRPSNATKILLLESSFMFMVSALSVEWAFQGMETMEMVFVSIALTGSLQVALAWTFIKGPKDLLRVPVIYLVASIPIIVIFLKKLKFRFKVGAGELKKIFKYLSSALVLWSISIFVQIYNNLDIFILGLFRQIEEVGCFSMARRATGGITFLAIFLSNALLPRLSCTYKTDPTGFDSALRKFLWVMVSLAVFCLLPAILFSRELITLTVGGQYISANMPFKIMLVGLALVLLNLPYSTSLIACAFEKDVLMQTFICAAFSLILNFTLIPKYGMIGAAVSFLCIEALALLWILSVFYRRIGTQSKGGGSDREKRV